MLQIQDVSIFYLHSAEHLFALPSYVLEPPWLQTIQLAELPLAKQKRIKALTSSYAHLKESWLAEHPFVEPTRVKHLLARHLGFSEAEQDHSLWHFPQALYERDKESGQPGTFDPFLDSDDVP